MSKIKLTKEERIWAKNVMYFTKDEIRKFNKEQIQKLKSLYED